MVESPHWYGLLETRLIFRCPQLEYSKHTELAVRQLGEAFCQMLPELLLYFNSLRSLCHYSQCRTPGHSAHSQTICYAFEDVVLF